MLAEERAVVAHEYEQSVLEQPFLFHGRSQTILRFVDGKHHLGTILNRRLGDLLIEIFGTELTHDPGRMLRVDRSRQDWLARAVLSGESEVGATPENLARVPTP